MPRRNATLFATLLSIVLAIPAIAHAELKDYVDAQTLVAAEADLTKVDAAALEPWIRQVMTAAGMTGTGPDALKPEDVDKAMSEMKRWLGDVAAAGGKHLYLVTQFDLLRMGGGYAIIAPADAGANANKLAALLNSGHADGPTTRPAQNYGGRDMSAYFPHGGIVNGNTAVFGTTTAFNYLKNLKAADRPDITEALQASGDSPIKVAIALTPSVRNLLLMQLPPKIYDQPASVVTQDVKWIGVGITAPPTFAIKAVGQATNAASAEALEHIATFGLTQLSGVPPTISPDMAKMLTPAVSNDQLIVTGDTDKMLAIAKELAPQLAIERKRAASMQAMNTERQLLQACMMYSAENNGKWPEDLQSVKKYIPNLDQILINLNHPELKPGYVYIKPASMNRAFETLVIYESHREFGKGVAVGYADGHCEIVSDKARFDTELARTAMNETPQ